jgi:hypothetical protein
MGIRALPADARSLLRIRVISPELGIVDSLDFQIKAEP